MRVVVVVVAVLSLAVLVQTGQAADLQAGWYVKIAGVGLYGQTPEPPYEIATGWNFTGDLGTYGPFEVSSPDPVWAERMVSVPASVSGVTPGTAVYLWGEPAYPVFYDVRRVDFHIETNYDASQMQLQLLMYKPDLGYTLLWSQSRSGYQFYWVSPLIFPQTIPLGYVPVFRVTTMPAVPEPGGVLLLLVGVGGVSRLLRRRS